jgi:hypothetical protein
MFEIIDDEIQPERATKAPVTLPTVQLDFYADLYLGSPDLRAEHHSFERFLVFVVRNGTIFETRRHHRARRYGRSQRPLKQGA